MNRAVVVLAGACVLLGSLQASPGAAARRRAKAASDREGYAFLADSVDTNAGKVNRARLRLADLEFRVAWTRNPPWGYDLVSLEAPPGWHVRGRSDLVAVIRHSLQEPDSLRRTLFHSLAVTVLPHIDTAEAAALYVDIGPQTKDRLVHMTWIFWPPPVPDDAFYPPIWKTHLGDPAVLAVLEPRVHALRTQDQALDTYALSVLTASNEPAALRLLQRAFEERPDRAARYVEDIVGGGHLARRPWVFLLGEVLPKFSRHRPQSGEERFALMAWWKLAEGQQIIDRTDHRDSLEALGHAFVEMVVAQRDASRLLYFPDHPAPPSRSADGGALGYSSGYCRIFLETCARFGDRDQGKRLEKILRPAEGWLRDLKARREWDALPGGSDNWSYQDLVNDYVHHKESALHLMQLREPPYVPTRR
jgi:hypothetical protein